MYLRRARAGCRAVHDGIEASQTRSPDCGIGITGKVAVDANEIRKTRMLSPTAYGEHRLMARGQQCDNDVAADETVGTSDQDAHGNDLQPHAAMDGDDTGAEIAMVHALQPGLTHHAGKRFLVWMLADRFGQITVAVGIAGNTLTQPRQHLE